MSNRIQADFVKRFADGPEIRVSLEVLASTGLTVLFGPSGVGKTTVLRCIAGLSRPDEGTIRFGDRLISDAKTGFFVQPRDRGIGFVPQEYALFPHLSVEGNLAYGLKSLKRRDCQTRVAEIVEWLELRGLEKRLPHELSGGQRQRVALGRAMARRPALLLLDEPLAALDAPIRSRLRSELRQLLKNARTPTLLVTHDRTDALALGDELVVMESGKVVQQGSPTEVFSKPVSPAVAGIVAVETIQPGRITEVGEVVKVVVGSQKLVAAGETLPTGARDVFVCIRAEDVILMKGEIAQSSARNCLPAVVRQITGEGPIIRVELDCGFPLIAFVTKQAREELALEKGHHVLALVKAPHVHLIPRGEN